MRGVSPQSFIIFTSTLPPSMRVLASSKLFSDMASNNFAENSSFLVFFGVDFPLFHLIIFASRLFVLSTIIWGYICWWDVIPWGITHFLISISELIWFIEYISKDCLNTINQRISTKQAITSNFISVKSYVKYRTKNMARLDQVMGSEPFPFDKWISNDNRYINKPT